MGVMFAPVSGPWDGGQGKSFENPSIIMRNGPGRKSRTKSCGRFPPMLYSSHIFEKKEGNHVEAGSADVLRGRKINFGKIQNFFGKGVTNRGSGTLYRVEGVGVRRWRPIPRGRWPSSDPAHAGPPSPRGRLWMVPYIIERYNISSLYRINRAFPWGEGGREADG